MAVLGLRFCARASSSCGERGPLFIVECGPLTVAASLVAEHRLQTRRLSSFGLGTRARTRVPCIGRQILNHCATREALEGDFLNQYVVACHLNQSSSPLRLYSLSYSLAAGQCLPSCSQHPRGKFVLHFNLFSEFPLRIDGLV